MQLNINSDEVIRLTVKLNKMGNKLLPIAVRNTLTNAAFETKTLIPAVAKSKFITRNKSLFRAFTGVNKAQGMKINAMQSEVGIIRDRPNGEKVATGLEKQETGGVIGNRGLIPLDGSRISDALTRKVKKANQLNRIKLKQKSGFILLQKGNKGTLFSVKGNGKRRKLKAIYSYKANRSVSIKKKGFIHDSSMLAVPSINKNFIREAEYQIKKLK